MDIDTIKRFLCERCFYLITVFTNDETHIDKSVFMALTSSSKCNFCFGVMYLEDYNSYLSDIKTQMIGLEYHDFKYSVNFSSAFNIVHHYWKAVFSKTKLVKNIEEIDISMLRVIFKQLFVSIIEQKLHESFNPQSDLEIEITFEFNDYFYQEMSSMLSYANKGKEFKQNEDKATIKNIIKTLMPSLIIELFKKYQFNQIALKDVLVKRFRLVKQNLYIKGNYLKFSRDIGQSPWEIKGAKVCPSSVEEELKLPLIKLFKCDDCVMSAGGREDRDVRMLGSGRPFIIEIVNPRISKVSDDMANAINSASKYIQVKNISMCNHEYAQEIKKYEEYKQKFYTCVIWCQRKITEDDIKMLNEIKDLSLIQKTPFRVLHRRTLMDRNKMIYKIEAKKINENFLIVDITASAGTYIKEFIHSDLGRTKPSMMSILQCGCDILQLDVLNIVYNPSI